VKTESLGSKTVEGVTAEGTRTTMTIPAGQVGNEQPMQTVVETWYSADLQTVVLSKRSDPRNGETVTRYTNISRTEPAHSLFEVPADYKVSDSAGRGSRPTSEVSGRGLKTPSCLSALPPFWRRRPALSPRRSIL
jgi:hypothetical protein